MPAKKAGSKKTVKKNKGKAVPRTSSKNAGAERRAQRAPRAPERERPSFAGSVAFQVIPFLIVIVAIYVTVCFIMSGSSEDIGNLGVATGRLLFGLFSGAAWLVPLLLVNLVAFWRRDIENSFVRYKLLFSLIVLTLCSSIYHMISHSPTQEDITAAQMFGDGIELSGGGLFGGYIFTALHAVVGDVGAGIFIFALTFVFTIFMFGYNPADFFKAVGALIKRLFTHLIIRGRERVQDRKNGKLPQKKYTYRTFPVPQQPVPAPQETPQPETRRKLEDVNPFTGAEEETEREQIPQPEVKEVKLGRNTEVPVKEFIIPSPDKATIRLDDIFPQSEDDVLAEKLGIHTETDKPVAAEAKVELVTQTKKVFDAQTMEQIHTYTFPPMTLLSKDTSTVNVDASNEQKTNGDKLVEALASFGVKTKIIGISRGPTITRYELQPEIGVKVRSIVNLQDDISLNLAASGVRIEAPIPGKAAVGIEVPNKIVATVHLRSLIEDEKFKLSASRLTSCLGMDVAGAPIYFDISRMPHLLIAGATGMGKSVCINSIITSILYKARPDEVKLILVDPKKVELNVYNGIPHLLVPVVSDPKKAAGTLNWAVNEMESRFMLIEEQGVRDIASYNKEIQQDPDLEPMPHIVIIIDELADLMMTAKDDVERSICRLAQKARAAGMHLIIGTQRPSVDVITGLIKANIPSRIAFTVASQIDSRTIIDIAGAERLIGRGDMLFAPVGCSKPLRVQGSFVSENEVEAVCAFLKTSHTAEYDDEVIKNIEKEAAACVVKEKKSIPDAMGDGDSFDDEPMLKPAIELAIESGTISTSLLQRRLSLGYSRAARIIDNMEKMGIVGPFEGSKPRKVLMSYEQYAEMMLNKE
ncbi:MAG: DNA translocase FtsK 4TM domain-containing protein [Eubacteriales bacterium]